MEPATPHDDATASSAAAKAYRHRTPRWVYVFVGVAVAGVLIFGALHLAGGGFGPHGL